MRGLPGRGLRGEGGRNRGNLGAERRARTQLAREVAGTRPGRRLGRRCRGHGLRNVERSGTRDGCLRWRRRGRPRRWLPPETGGRNRRALRRYGGAGRSRQPHAYNADRRSGGSARRRGRLRAGLGRGPKQLGEAWASRWDCPPGLGAHGRGAGCRCSRAGGTGPKEGRKIPRPGIARTCRRASEPALEVLAFGKRLGDEYHRVVYAEGLVYSAPVRRGQALEQPQKLGAGTIESALEEVDLNHAASGPVFGGEASTGVSAGLPEQPVLGIELVTGHGRRAEG